MGERGWVCEDPGDVDEDNAVESCTSDDDNDQPARWIKVRRSFHINKYGNASALLNKCFTRTLKKRQLDELPNGKDDWSVGKVVAVVFNREVEDGTKHFKFYNPHTHVGGPPDDEGEYSYALCSAMMSASRSNAYKWMAEATTEPSRPNPSKRKKKRTFYRYEGEDGFERDESEIERLEEAAGNNEPTYLARCGCGCKESTLVSVTNDPLFGCDQCECPIIEACFLEGRRLCDMCSAGWFQGIQWVDAIRVVEIGKRAVREVPCGYGCGGHVGKDLYMGSFHPCKRCGYAMHAFCGGEGDDHQCTRCSGPSSSSARPAASSRSSSSSAQPAASSRSSSSSAQPAASSRPGSSRGRKREAKRRKIELFDSFKSAKQRKRQEQLRNEASRIKLRRMVDKRLRKVNGVGDGDEEEDDCISLSDSDDEEFSDDDSEDDDGEFSGDDSEGDSEIDEKTEI